MYNLYIHEKQLSDFEKTSNEKKKILKYESKRKRKINSLTQKYNNRMKNFVLTLCDNPVILGQNENNDEFSKTQDLFRSNDNDPKNNFVFGEYMTDKKKVEILNQEKMLLKKYEEINKQLQRKRDILNARKNNNVILLQPRMKFGPREEIENIVDLINKNGSYFVNKKYTKILNEHLKKQKDNNVRYVKRYDILKNNYGENFNEIKNNILKDDYQENEYSYKKVIGSKLSNNVNNEYQNKKNKILEYKDPIDNNNDKNNKIDSHNTKKVLNGNNSKVIKTNELKKLFNDNRKLYFKGASQFISLKLVKPKEKQFHNSSDDLQEISVIYTDKNIYFKKGNNLTNIKKDIKKEEDKKLTRQKSMPTLNKKDKKPKINMKIFSPANQNQNSHNNYLNKYLNLDYSQKSSKYSTPLNRIMEENLSVEDSPKGLCEESKIKKIKMNNLIKNEINKSIVNNYIDKYDIIKEFNKHNTINTNSLYFQGYHNNFIEKQDEHLNEKLKYLLKVIKQRNKELMKENNNTSSSYMNSTGHFKSSNKKEKNKVKKVASNDYILIDGQFISKKDIKALSDVIFTKCNFYKKKRAESQRNTLKNNEKLLHRTRLSVNNFYSKIGS